MSVRIIAGEKRGSVLQTPPGAATRPTLARVRESLFMILQFELPGARVLDLFAGSGALGIEALSRGAEFATFVEHDRAAQGPLEINLRKLGYTTRARVLRREALEFLAAGNAGAPPYDVILLDPPYATDLAARVLDLLGAGLPQWLAGEGTVVVQVGAREVLPEAAGALNRTRAERYGATQIAFYRPAQLP